jgi:hypothetical protein
VTFSDAQRLRLAPRSSTTLTLRIRVASGPAGGRVLLRVNGNVPAPFSPATEYELNHDGTHVDVTR